MLLVEEKGTVKGLAGVISKLKKEKTFADCEGRERGGKCGTLMLCGRGR